MNRGLGPRIALALRTLVPELRNAAMSDFVRLYALAVRARMRVQVDGVLNQN